ncbi:MAG: rhomboid family intramembrane serine protease [Halothece sp.]
MIPLHDNNPTRETPVITYGLIGLNVAIFLYQLSLSPSELEAFFATYAVIPNELSQSFQGGDVQQSISPWFTLFTSQFLHGGILHIVGNMLYLRVFGNNIEDAMGKIWFLGFYLSCGAFAALAQWFFSMNSEVPLLGASGAIAGIMGAYILRFPAAQILTLLPLIIIWTTIRLPAFVFLGIWFAQQAIYGFATLESSASIGTEGGGVAYWAHAGGFVAGAVLGPLFGLFRED